ncbi:hypothetical protein ACLB2K_013717 [Fragaria x ananassa]
MVKMCSFNKLMTILVVAMLVSFEGSRAFTFCNMSEDGLTACKPSVMKPNPSDPTAECCKDLSAADLDCLCGYKTSPVLPGFGIDPTLAMGLPAKCGLTPPANC